VRFLDRAGGDDQRQSALSDRTIVYGKGTLTTSQRLTRTFPDFWSNERRKNDPHASTTDADAGLYLIEKGSPTYMVSFLLVVSTHCKNFG
jgi:hypothetical protein